MQSNNLHYSGAEKKKEETKTPYFKEMDRGLFTYIDSADGKDCTVTSFFEVGSRVDVKGKSMRIKKIMGRTIVLKTD